MNSNPNPLRICGWMQFKNQATGEKATTPAIASFETRPVNYGEQNRMALTLRSPFTEASGTWDQIRHDCWVQGNVETAKQWYAVGFSPNDPSAKEAIAKTIDELLSNNPRELAKKKIAERRVSTCRFDDWLKGWSTDLVWDPFQYLESSTKMISILAESGRIMPEDEEVYAHWIEQPPNFTAQKTYSGDKPWAKKESTKTVQPPSAAQAPAQPKAPSQPKAPAPAQAPSALNFPIRYEPQIPESFLSQEALHGQNRYPEHSSLPSDNYVPLDPDSLPSSEPQSIESSPEDYPFGEDFPEPNFADEPDTSTLLQNNEAPAPISAGNPAAKPAPPPKSEHNPLPQPDTPTPPAANAQPKQAEPDVPELDSHEELEKSIFGGPDLPDFAELATFNGQAFTRQDTKPSATANVPSTHAPRPQAPAEQTEALMFNFARFPAQEQDGSIDWTLALIVCENFMQAKAFNISKGYRLATREGMQGRNESLYSMELMMDLTQSGIPFTLLGQSPSGRFERQDGAHKRLDGPNFALFALGKNAHPLAQNIAGLARAKFYRERAAEIASKAVRIPHPDIPAAGWIQLSPGPARLDATKVHPDLGLIQWRQPHSEPAHMLCAQLADSIEREKLAKACSAFAIAREATSQAINANSIEMLDENQKTTIEILPSRAFSLGVRKL